MKVKLIFALAFIGLLSVQTGYTQQSSEEGGLLFDPKMACGDILPVTQTIDKVMVGLWASGYLAGRSGIVVPMGEVSNEVLLERLNLACAQSIDAPLVTIVEYVGEDLAASEVQFEVGSTDLIPGSPAHGRAIIEGFLNSEDRAALTARLIPTAQEVRMIYAEPLASLLIDWYSKVLLPDNIVISPKPEQTELISFFTTIDELIESPKARFYFPGGYNEILQYFITDAPIATFKFVRPGNDVGLTINGLIYINDRWVIMPKPWRALREN